MSGTLPNTRGVNSPMPLVHNLPFILVSYLLHSVMSELARLMEFGVALDVVCSYSLLIMGTFI